MSNKLKKSGLLAVSIIAMGAVTAQAGDGYVPPLPSAVPSGSTPGECYARVQIPAQTETRQQQVMVQEGYTEYQVQQAQVTSRAQQVMVKEPSVEYRVRQPRYTTVSEQMMVRPAYEKLQVSPPEFRTVTENMQVTGPKLVWKKGNPASLRAQGYVIHSTANGGPGGQGFHSTTQYGATQSDPKLCGNACEIWCLVEEPGQSVSFTRRVMTKPSQVHRVPVDARYQTITKQVLADPGGVEEIPIPAQFQTVTVEDVYPARATGANEVPAQFDNVSVNVPVSDESWEWRRVVCETGTYMEPTGAVSAPVTTHSAPAPSYNGNTSGYIAPPVTQHMPSYNQAPTHHSGSAIHQYEGVVCNKGDKSRECYGRDVIKAYERSQHSSGAQHHGSYDGSHNYSQNQTQSDGITYDQATGYYEDARRAYDAYETVTDRRDRRRRR